MTSPSSASFYSTPASEGAQPILPPQPLMVHVTAPETLPAGYIFNVAIDDRVTIIPVEVPPGGVRKGQIFLTPLPSTYAGPRLAAPTGAWKDGLFDCCSATTKEEGGGCSSGWTHPSLWCSFCCLPLALAQVITRMRLSYIGQPNRRLSFDGGLYVFDSTALLFASTVMFFILAVDYSYEEEDTSLYWLNVGLFVTWIVWALYNTRKNVRARYSIPPLQHLNQHMPCCCNDDRSM